MVAASGVAARSTAALFVQPEKVGYRRAPVDADETPHERTKDIDADPLSYFPWVVQVEVPRPLLVSLQEERCSWRTQFVPATPATLGLAHDWNPVYGSPLCDTTVSCKASSPLLRTLLSVPNMVPA